MADTAKAASLPAPPTTAGKRSFLLRKLFSLTGVVPVAGFTLFHLWKNATALHGREAFNEMVEEINSLPYLLALEVGVIILPILFHAALGLLFVIDARYNVGTYRYSRNWMFTLQRLAGVAAFAFILFHLYELRWPKLMGTLAHSSFYDTLCRSMSTTVHGVPLNATIYVLGIAAVAFHLANGLWGFMCSWGVTVTRHSQRLSAAALGVVGLLVFALGANTTVYFATGSKLFIPSRMGVDAEDTTHCPVTARETWAVELAPQAPPSAAAEAKPSSTAPAIPAPEPPSAAPALPALLPPSTAPATPPPKPPAPVKPPPKPPAPVKPPPKPPAPATPPPKPPSTTPGWRPPALKPLDLTPPKPPTP